MKRLMIFCSISLMFSCGGESYDGELDEDQLPVNSKYADGKEVYKNSCVACHMKDGKGLEGVFPPLASSDYLLADPKRALKQVKYGSEGKMEVNGILYDEVMPPQAVSDEEAVQVVNYILNAWGNDGGEVTEADLKKIE